MRNLWPAVAALVAVAACASSSTSSGTTPISASSACADMCAQATPCDSTVVPASCQDTCFSEMARNSSAFVQSVHSCFLQQTASCKVKAHYAASACCQAAWGPVATPSDIADVCTTAMINNPSCPMSLTLSSCEGTFSQYNAPPAAADLASYKSCLLAITCNKNDTKCCVDASHRCQLMLPPCPLF
jgi:hypothetical protein